jgi:hypothetical protein
MMHTSFHRWPHPTAPEPDFRTLQTWMCGRSCEATDGCPVEHDGVCRHGHPSWLIVLGHT